MRHVGLADGELRLRPAGADAEGEDFELRLVRHQRVARGIDVLERLADRFVGRRIEFSGRDRHVDLVELADEAHVGGALDRDVRRICAGCHELRPAFRGKRVEGGVERFGVELGRQLHRVRAHQIEGERRGEEAEGGRGTAGLRDDDLGHAEDMRHAGSESRPGAAEADHRIAARVLALLDEVDAGSARHVLADDLVDAPCGLHRGDVERLGDGLQRLVGRVEVERHSAAEEEGRIVIAERDAGVGDGRLVAALSVAGGAGRGTGGVRTHLKQADLVDGGDGAAAGADLDHVHHGRLDRQAGPVLEAAHAARFQIGGDVRHAVLDHAGLGGGAAHVEGDEVVLAGLLAEPRGGKRPAGGAGLQQADRELARLVERDEAASRMHEAHRAAEAARRQLALEPAEVAVHERLDIGVGAGGDEALVFGDFRHDFRGDGH